MADEDLGSFFAEIEKIEVEQPLINEVTNNTSTISSISSSLTQAPAQASQGIESKVIYKQAKVASKPVVETHTSHPVYTYEYPNLGVNQTNNNPPAETNAYSHYTKINPSSSSSFTSSTYHSSTAPPLPPGPINVAPPSAPRTDKTYVRTGGGEIWKDDSLNEWPEGDFRIFVGDLAKEVTTEQLAKHFQHYKSFAKAKVNDLRYCMNLRILHSYHTIYIQVMRTKHENKARGFGFVSFLDPMDCAKAIREQNGGYKE